MGKDTACLKTGMRGLLALLGQQLLGVAAR
jgi:hypothetical protein